MMDLPVSIKLSSIRCNDEADGIGNAEPYLWTIFFKIDGQNIKQFGVSLKGKAAFAFGPGSHENLRTHAVIDGESVKIPAILGEFKTTLSPIIIKDFSNKTYQIPGTVGVAAILMEEDNVSDSGAEAGHKALNKFVEDSINNFISGINLAEFANEKNPQEKLDELIAELVKKIKKDSAAIVSDAVKNKQPWYNDLWAFVNADDNIGSEIWMFDQAEIVNKRFQINFNQRWTNQGDWEIFGEISAPDPCLKQLIAVNQQKSKIKNVDDAIRALQKEFREAPAAQKPAIKAEIEETKKQLKPLQTELKRLVSLLNQCYNKTALTNVGIIGGTVRRLNN